MNFVKQFENFISSGECQKIIDIHDDNYFSYHAALNQNSISSFHFFKKNGCKDFVSLLDNEINFTARIIECINLYKNNFPGMKLSVEITNLWLNKQTYGSELKFHTHDDSVISGALYLKVDNESSYIHFKHPGMNDLVIKPTFGTLILFPSWLSHGSAGINKSTERIVLSFNTQYFDFFTKSKNLPKST